MTKTEVDKVYQGMYLLDKMSRTDTHPNGKVFAVLCNCPSSAPRRHTLRYVQNNPAEFEFAAKEDLDAAFATSMKGQTDA